MNKFRVNQEEIGQTKEGTKSWILEKKHGCVCEGTACSSTLLD